MYKTLNELQIEAHKNAKEKGFWDKDRNLGEALALVHEEVSEALKALKHEKIEEFKYELADIIIRVMDLAGGLDIDLEKYITAKLAYNKTRPYMHGGSF